METDPIHTRSSYNCPESKQVYDNTIGKQFKKPQKSLLFHSFQKDYWKHFFKFSNTTFF